MRFQRIVLHTVEQSLLPEGKLVEFKSGLHWYHAMRNVREKLDFQLFFKLMHCCRNIRLLHLQTLGCFCKTIRWNSLN